MSGLCSDSPRVQIDLALTSWRQVQLLPATSERTLTRWPSAVAMTLALLKRLPQQHAKLAMVRVGPGVDPGREKGAVCGILGFGGIGKATGRLLRGLGVRIHAVNTTGRTDEPVDFIGTLDDLDTLLAAADVVIIALPLTPRTQGLIGARELGLMQPNAILINVARGAIVDQTALYQRLRTYEEFSAGIDAWWVEPFGSDEFRLEFPFFDLPNVLGSPQLCPGSREHGRSKEASRGKHPPLSARATGDRHRAG
jgi:phosphoglycerate dehydrogenase-like enzyme